MGNIKNTPTDNPIMHNVMMGGMGLPATTFRGSPDGLESTVVAGFMPLSNFLNNSRIYRNLTLTS